MTDKPKTPTGRPESPISSETITKIKEWWQQGYTVPIIVLELEQHGIYLSYHTVYNIAKNKTYKEQVENEQRDTEEK